MDPYSFHLLRNGFFSHIWKASLCRRNGDGYKDQYFAGILDSYFIPFIFDLEWQQSLSASFCEKRSFFTHTFIQDWVEGSPDKYNNIIEEKEINGILYPVLFFICITRGHFSFFPSDHISSTHTYTTYHILPLLYIRISLFNSASSNQMLQQPQASKNRGNFLFFGMRVRNVWPDFFDERLRACLLA